LPPLFAAGTRTAPRYPVVGDSCAEEVSETIKDQFYEEDITSEKSYRPVFIVGSYFKS